MSGRFVTTRRRMAQRLADERGIAVPIAIIVLLIVSLLVGVAVAYSVRSVQRSNYDRYSARAQAAADAGLDIAGWRMNKLLIGGNLAGLTSFVNNQVLTLGCTSVNVSGAVVLSSGSGSYCPETDWESVDREGGTSSGEQFRYYTQLRADVSVTGDLDTLTGQLLSRKVVVVGRANGRTARVLGLYQVQLDKIASANSLASIFTLKRYVQCPSTGFTASAPANGCPSVD